MSSKQLLRLAALLATVLVLWGAVALASRRSERGAPRTSVLSHIDTAAVDTIALTGRGDTALLTRSGKGKAPWLANGHPADSQAVQEMLRGLADRDPSAELVASNPASHARLGVSSDSGKRVRVVSRGKTVADLLAGRQASNGEGTYLRRLNAPEVYVVGGDLSTALSRQADSWRDHTIATVTPDSVGGIEVTRGKRSYSLRRKGTSWAFGSGNAADSAAVTNLLSGYAKLDAVTFATRQQQDSLRFSRGRRAAKLLDRKGTPLLALTFDSLASGIWVRIEGSPTGQGAASEAYRLDTWTADRLTPPDSALRKR